MELRAEQDLPLDWQQARAQTRRQFLKRSQTGLGAIALAMLMDRDGTVAAPRGASRIGRLPSADNPMAPRPPHFAPRAKRVIYLHMSGGPPQQDLFDEKPALVKHHMQPCPDELLKGQKFAFIKGHPKLLGSPYQFRKCGQSGAVDQRAPAAPARRGRRDGDHQVDVDRPVQPCAGGAVPLHRLVAQRRGGDGLVDHLWPGHGEPGPARLRRPDQRRHRPDRRQGAVEHRVPAQRLPGRAMPDGGRPGPVRQRPEGHGPLGPPSHARRAAAAQRVRAVANSATPRR